MLYWIRINLHKNDGYVMLLMEMLTISRGKRVGKPTLSYCIASFSDSVVHTHSLLKRQGFSATNKGSIILLLLEMSSSSVESYFILNSSLLYCLYLILCTLILKVNSTYKC